MKTISVLIAAWQARAWLADCLHALQSQVLPSGWQLQVLVGVDGCEDTLAWLRSAHVDGIEVVYLRQNSGTYITFNTLMRYASGELIARFDADDVMQSGYLAAHIAAIVAGADMTLSWSIYTDAQLKPTSRVMAHSVYHPEHGLNRRGAEGQFVIRRAVWQALGGFRPWRCGADTDFFKRVRCAGFAHQVIEQFLYLRRTHAGSLTVDAATNFQSPLRLAIQKRVARYQEQYLAGTRGLKIRAQTASAHECLAMPAHKPHSSLTAPLDPVDPIDPPAVSAAINPVDSIDSIDPIDPVDTVAPTDAVDPVNLLSPVNPVAFIDHIDHMEPHVFRHHSHL